MSRRTNTQLPTADVLLKPHVETNVKEMLTMKDQRSQKYYDKTAHELPALKEGNVVRVKPNPGDKTLKWRRGQIISKLGELSYLVDVNGKGYQRNWKFLRTTSEPPNTTFKNTPEETLETMKYNIDNKAFTQSPSKGAHSLIKDVQQEQKGADTKNSKPESNSPAMKAQSEVTKERTSKEGGHMTNEN